MEPLLLVDQNERLPAAVDEKFPTASLEPRYAVRWARTLFNQCLYFQADSVLKNAVDDHAPQIELLRAQLDTVRLKLCRNLGGRSLGYDRGRVEGELVESIWKRLRLLTIGSPKFGEGWLALANFYLEDKGQPEDLVHALEFAQRARELLGSVYPDVIPTLGKALRLDGQPAKALDLFTTSLVGPTNSKRLEEESELAKWEILSAMEPPDPVACLKIGRRLIAENENAKAFALFNRLAQSMPGSAEAQWALGRLKMRDLDIPVLQRVSAAYEYAKRALELNPEFGLAHELMGQALRAAPANGLNFSDPLSWREYFRRAVQLDNTVDIAMAALAEEAIEFGDAEKAFALLERAVGAKTQQNGVFLRLAVFYQAQRNPEKQNWAYDQAKRLEPDHELAPDHKNRILSICGFHY